MLKEEGDDLSEEEMKDFLVDRAKQAVNQLQGEEEDEGLEMNVKRGSWDERVEQQASRKSSGSWSQEEIEFLKNNRKEMDNDEMQEFMEKDSEFHEVDWQPFSRSQERYIIQNYRRTGLEELAEQMDRDEDVLRLKMKMMGLNMQEVD
ncbi:MAG: hypothetical protein ABEJ93_04990 [Candidatus Nanohalobium sp.]